MLICFVSGYVTGNFYDNDRISRRIFRYAQDFFTYTKRPFSKRNAFNTYAYIIGKILK